MIHKFRINKNTHFQTSPGGDFRGAQKLAYDSEVCVSALSPLNRI